MPGAARQRRGNLQMLDPKLKDCFASLEGRTPECRARRERGPACNDDSCGLSKCYWAQVLDFEFLEPKIKDLSLCYKRVRWKQVGIMFAKLTIAKSKPH